MDSSHEYEPVEPGAEVERLRAQWLEAPLRFRVLLTAYLAIGAWGGLVGSHLLTSAYSNCFTWSIVLLILEPVGVTSLAALLFLYWPNSWIGRRLQNALHRVKLATLILAACVLGWLAWVVVYIAAELWKLR